MDLEHNYVPKIGTKKLPISEKKSRRRRRREKFVCIFGNYSWKCLQKPNFQYNFLNFGIIIYFYFLEQKCSKKNNTKISGWGRYPTIDAQSITYQNVSDLRGKIKKIEDCIARGNGRSYGDSCLNDGGTLLHMRDLNQIIEFDSENGILRSHQSEWHPFVEIV